MSDTNKKLLRRDEACAYLREQHGIYRRPATLAKYACEGGGPKFRKDGRFPLYETADLDEWAEGQLTPKVSSSTEARNLQTDCK